jgi:hypothetical protein
MARSLTKTTRQRARDAFLAELRKHGIISDAARAVGFNRQLFYEWREEDPEFAKAWDDALDEAAGTLEREAWRRAIEGVEEPIVGRVERDRDGVVAHVRKYSDSLLTTLLKAHRPEKYRERYEHELRGAIQIEYVNDWRKEDPSS